LVIVAAVREDRQLVQCCTSHGALPGRWRKRFSIITVCACTRMTLSEWGW
jgi:hypothetical protein